MADNVAFTPGTGATGATDDIGGVHYPRVKTTWGPDGTANDADVATGKPLPVQVRSATGLIPIGEPTDAKSTATDTTSVTLVSIVKQLSASLQTLAAAIKNEDVASADADPGVVVHVRETAAPAATVGTDGDYGPPQGYKGHLWVAPPPVTKVSANFTAAGTTPSYTSGEWISDNATAGSVTKISWSIPRASGIIRRVRIRKSDQTVATPTIRLYLWDTTFTVAVGNDASGAQPLADSMGYVDVAVVTAGSDDASGWTNCDISFSAATIYGLLQSQSSFTGATSEVWTIDLWYLPG